MNSKEKILSRISDALKNKSNLKEIDNSVDEKIRLSLKKITPSGNDALWSQFKLEIEKIAGEYNSFSSIENAAEFITETLSGLDISRISIDNTAIAEEINKMLSRKGIKAVNVSSLSSDEKKRTLAEVNCSVVSPAFAVADIGSLVFLMDDTLTSYPHYLCDNTIAIVKKENITANQFELFEKLDVEKSKNMFFVTGPSRTADIEKVLVLGAHGPRRLIVISIE